MGRDKRGDKFESSFWWIIFHKYLFVCNTWEAENKQEKWPGINVTRSGDLLSFGQLLNAFGNT